jgi:hypothetical protein
MIFEFIGEYFLWIVAAFLVIAIISIQFIMFGPTVDEHAQQAELEKKMATTRLSPEYDLKALEQRYPKEEYGREDLEFKYTEDEIDFGELEYLLDTYGYSED